MSQVSRERLRPSEDFLPPYTTPEDLCTVCDEMIEEEEMNGDIDAALCLREIIASKLPSHESFQDWIDDVYYESKGYAGREYIPLV